MTSGEWAGVLRGIGQIRLFPGVGQLLADLAGRGVVLAVVSSNSIDNVRQVLGPENAARIGHYECGASICGKRPKLRAVLRASGVPAVEAIAIGDEIRDLEAARAEGIAFGAVSWGYTETPPYQLGADAVVERFADIPAALARLRPR